MTSLTSLGILLCFVSSCYGIKCFECQNLPDPRDCSKLMVCNSDEICFTDQVVLASGNVSFNSGCLPKSQCVSISTALIGKRSAKIVNTRSTDSLMCRECCVGDFCNMKGCGTHEIPIKQRGPYCYTCDIQNPKDCTNVTVCGKNELCMLYHSLESSGRPDAMHRGQCESQAECNAITQAFGTQNCNPICCNTDFCNDRCGTLSNITMSTSHPHTSDDKTTMSDRHSTLQQHMGQTTELPDTLTTKSLKDHTTEGNKQTATTKPNLHTVTTAMTTLSSTKSYCNKGNYVYLQNAHAQLCIHVVNRHKPVSWDDARASCKAKGEDLAVLDTHEKALLVRGLLRSHSQYNQTFYWIGAKDFNNNNHFTWTDGQTLVDKEADWDRGKPDHVVNGNDQDCVSIYNNFTHNRYFKWHDLNCENRGHFICERK
ncbi:uncharacterized protein LOC128546006 isoform X1 [Mercenaria mercenaria]|uniref:uncharacterized protein LOC128546006 isoform X1 n=1 Tax=Mercenaria mercenaria TaxID=6596 RepID=UPI00234E521A|nr:uncharacterized protein LOC128546006 isoform X1 [Mercenaria mercenaria]